ncbi:DUF3785 family protein [Clostridium sp. LIBA-8841]|uniref:DUF3785 family protein n=1 Tax=Clostridium sp. LIBA-8841 TaxID=2987530 RepID=UPI002AC540EE|nr:DUF3785 family protein [Clostridium sp. LIBA-8841]MDZ5252483.1 DUF3785 domain-containing protein [Clostridium sp. LIBA-8841]
MFSFTFDEKEYNLSEDKLIYFFNEDVDDFDIDKLFEILNNSEKVSFGKAYYDGPCEECKFGLDEKIKSFPFLEFNMFIYTKNGKFVISNIEKSYEGLTYNKLLRAKKVDKSYLLNINVCKNCGNFAVEVEELDV